MSRPNVHGLPQHLRRDARGYFLDYSVLEGGIEKRKRVRLGQIPFAQAKKVLALHMQEIVEKKFLSVEKKATFDEAADSFLAYSRARRKTFKNDSQMVGRLKAFFGNRTLESLNPDIVEGFITQRLEAGNRQFQGKALAGTTVNRDIGILKSIIHRAILNGLIEKNPIRGVKKFKEIPRDRVLEPEEYQRLLDHCRPHIRAMVQLAYLTGMRRGEILGLRWDQVDLANKVIVLEAADTKTQEKREVPLSGLLVELLKRNPKTLGSPYVFTYKGERIQSIKTGFLRACRQAGIGNFKFHDLRHCAVTNLRKAGVSDTVIMSISGHKTYAMFKRYNRIDRGDRLSAVQKAEALIDTNKTREVDAQAAK
jgi:integrase